MASYKTCYHCGKIILDSESCPCEEDRLEEKRKKRAEYMREYEEKNEEVVKPLKTKRWQTLRRQVIQRDGDVCQRCLALYNILTYKNLEVHHIKPRIKYPELIFEPTNCITLCSTCNRELGTQEELDFVPIIDPKEEITYNL